MKVRQLIRRLEKDGWRWISTRGSHRKFVHPWKPGHVTVPGTMGDDLPVGTLKSVYRQAGWEDER